MVKIYRTSLFLGDYHSFASLRINLTLIKPSCWLYSRFRKAGRRETVSEKYSFFHIYQYSHHSSQCSRPIQYRCVQLILSGFQDPLFASYTSINYII